MKLKSILLSLLTLTACSTDLIENDAPLKVTEGIIMTAKDFEPDSPSRTNLDITDKGAVFSWAENDTVGVFPNEGGQVLFPMISGAGTKTASFNGGGWALKPSSNYAAYYPFNMKNMDMRYIEVLYDGQTQIGDASTDHLGLYDYMAAKAQTPVDGNVSFDFQHLGCLVRLKIDYPDFAKLESVRLVAEKESFMKSGVIDLSDGNPKILCKNASQDFTVKLKNIETSENLFVATVYMMLPPIDLQNQTINVEVRTVDGYVRKGAIQGKKLNAGKSYSFDVIVEPEIIATTFQINLKNPETLDDYLVFDKSKVITDLKVSGLINGTDIQLIHKMCVKNYQNENPQLKKIDLSGAYILSGGNSYFERVQGSYPGTYVEYFKTKTRTVTQFMFSEDYQQDVLEELILPDNIIEIEDGSLPLGLKKFHIPDSLSILHYGSIPLCAITNPLKLLNVSIVEGFNNNIENVIFSNKLKQIKAYAFSGGQLESIVIPESVTSIGTYAFSNCSNLHEIDIKAKISELPDRCFEGCNNTQKIILPETIKSIGYAALPSQMKNLYILAKTPPYYPSNSFVALPTNCNLYVPRGCVNVYKQHEQWGVMNVLPMR